MLLDLPGGEFGKIMGARRIRGYSSCPNSSFSGDSKGPPEPEEEKEEEEPYDPKAEHLGMPNEMVRWFLAVWVTAWLVVGVHWLPFAVSTLTSKHTRPNEGETLRVKQETMRLTAPNCRAGMLPLYLQDVGKKATAPSPRAKTGLHQTHRGTVLGEMSESRGIDFSLSGANLQLSSQA